MKEQQQVPLPSLSFGKLSDDLVGGRPQVVMDRSFRSFGDFDDFQSFSAKHLLYFMHVKLQYPRAGSCFLLKRALTFFYKPHTEISFRCFLHFDTDVGKNAGVQRLREAGSCQDRAQGFSGGRL
jgi:hypothetical protein